MIKKSPALIALLLAGCSAVPDAQKIIPPPEVMAKAVPLPSVVIKTATDCANDDLRVVKMYKILGLQNDEKADWIKTIYGVK